MKTLLIQSQLAARDLRVLQVHPHSSDLGGSGAVALSLALGLPTRGFEVRTILGGEGPLLASFEARDLDYLALPELGKPIRPIADARAFQRLRKLSRDWQPAVILLHASKAGALGRVLGRISGIPAVYVPHNWAYTKASNTVSASLYVTIERLLRGHGHTIVVSEHERDVGRRHRTVSESAVHLIYPGVAMPSRRASPRPGGRPLRVVMVARFAPPKDHATLLRAVAELNPGDVHLTLVGGGDDLPSRQLAWSLGIAKYTRFLGEVADVPGLLPDFDTLVLSSLSESLPISVLEAQACGLPPIASSVGGIPEVIEHGRTGFLFSPGDHRELACILKSVLRSPGLLQQISRSTQESCRHQFSEQAMLSQYAALLEQVADRRR